jgi:hypothetical protein
VRNAARIVSRWRHRLAGRYIVAATRPCEPFLKALGYETDLRALVPPELVGLAYPFEP